MYGERPVQPSSSPCGVALSQAVPETGAGRMGALKLQRCRDLFQPQNRSGTRPSYLKFTKGGGGATFGFDGWSHISPVSSMGGARVPDVELHELSFPHRILTYEYHKDSAGAGKWRGGYGACFRLQFTEDGTTLVGSNRER